MAAGLGVRTVQRIERDGQASIGSARALAAALNVDLDALGRTAGPGSEGSAPGPSTDPASSDGATLF